MNTRILLETSRTAVGGSGTDIINDVAVHDGTWKAFVVLDGTTQIQAYTDNGSDPCVIPLSVVLPAGAYIAANGKFTQLTLAVAGMIAAVRP